MSKITLTLIILFSLRAVAYDEGVDPNDMNSRAGAGGATEAGIAGCPTGDCNPDLSKFKPLTVSKESAEAISAQALKDAINRKSDKYKLRPEDIAPSPEEIEQKRRDVIKGEVNRKDVDETTEKAKKGMELREGAGGETSIGGVKVKVKAAPSRGGAKIKVKGEF